MVSVVVVIVVVGAVLAVKLTGGNGSSGSGSGATLASPDVVHAATNVPTAALDAAGVAPSTSVAPPQAIKPPLAPVLTKNGHPEILYMGAEYCPYCAAERWPLVVALSRFGTFSGLGVTHSIGSDIYPNTATFSFYGSHYTSKYVTFVPVELAKNYVVNGQYAPLQTPTKAQNALMAKYDVPPYVANQQQSGSIPFIDFANRYLVIGATYSPQVLQGLSMGTIAGSLSQPTSPQAKLIDAAANDITAAICKVTGGQPGSVCSSKVIAKAQSLLPKATAGSKGSSKAKK